MSAFEKGWRTFKIAIYALGALFVLVLALGFYANKDKAGAAKAKAPAPSTPPPSAAVPRTPVPSPPVPRAPAAVAAPPASATAAPPGDFVRQLERGDRETVRKLLFEGVLKAGPEESRQVVEWLMPRRFRGDLPYLYFVGVYLAKQGDDARKTEGLEFLLTGALVYRIDAGKCGDPTANQAVPILESALGIPKVREHLKQRPMYRKLVIATVVLKEIQSGPRPLPEWICAHGLRGGKPPDAAAFKRHQDAVIRDFVDNY